MNKIIVLIIGSLMLVNAYGQRITPGGIVWDVDAAGQDIDSIQIWIDDLAAQTNYRSELIVKLRETERRMDISKEIIAALGGDYQAYNKRNFANSIQGLESYSVNGTASRIYISTSGSGDHKVRKYTVDIIITKRDSIINNKPVSRRDTVINNIDVAFNTITLQSRNHFIWDSKKFVQTIGKMGVIWRNEQNWQEWFK